MTNFLMDNFVFMDDFAIKKGWFPSTRKPTTFWDFAGPFCGVVSPYQPLFFHYTLYINHHQQFMKWPSLHCWLLKIGLGRLLEAVLQLLACHGFMDDTGIYLDVIS
jgi:hypothetical protein